MARKKIDEKIRKKVIEAHASGQPMRKIAKEYGVGLSTVHRIVKEKGPQKVRKKITKGTSKAERLRRIGELERKIAELEAKILDLEAKKGSWGR
ncbi:MAG: helix-turn-helix domain-containing protein [Deltaproteobacteria bacterium]|jgi:transposase|nr:MAG: helix-turn-helix domain-containing protein [Deltaproteobacteria bacterium]